MKLKRETKVLAYDENRKRNNKRNNKRFVSIFSIDIINSYYILLISSSFATRFSLYLKMFFLMGIPWLTEIISWAHNDDESLWQYVWYITDFINIARAVFIFVMFCCKRKVWIKATKVAPWLHRCDKFILRVFSKKESVDVGMVEQDTSSVNPGHSGISTKDSSIVISESSKDENKMKKK